MPEPNYKYRGEDYIWGGQELNRKIQEDLGPGGWQELIDYRAGRSSIGPRPGYDYLLKIQRDPEDARELERALYRKYQDWKAQGWGGELPSAPVEPTNILEEDQLLKALMEQRR